MCSESTVALGQPSEMKPTLGMEFLFAEIFLFIIQKSIIQRSVSNRRLVQSSPLVAACHVTECVYANLVSNPQPQHKSCWPQPVPTRPAQHFAWIAARSRQAPRLPALPCWRLG